MRKNAKRIGLAIVGAGRVGLFRGEVAARHPMVDFIGIADLKEERLELVQAKTRADFASTDFRELLKRPEVTAAIISTDIGNSDKIVSHITEWRRQEIGLLPPDVNASDWEFTVEYAGQGDERKEVVRFGLGAVKNAGETAVRSIMAARAARPEARFTSLEDFCDAVDWSAVNRRVVECLVKCGALDSLGSRGTLLASLDGAIGAAQRRQKWLELRVRNRLHQGLQRLQRLVTGAAAVRLEEEHLRLQVAGGLAGEVGDVFCRIALARGTVADHARLRGRAPSRDGVRLALGRRGVQGAAGDPRTDREGRPAT